MTKREFLENVIAGKTADEMVEFAKHMLEQLDNTNAKRRAKTAEKQGANAVLMEQLVGFAGAEPKTASDFLADFVAAEATRPDGKDFNVQFVSNLARAAVAEGKLVASDVKIPKKGVQKGYSLAE